MSARIVFAASNGGYSFAIALAVASDIGIVEHRRQVGLIVERHLVVVQTRRLSCSPSASARSASGCGRRVADGIHL